MKKLKLILGLCFVVSGSAAQWVPSGGPNGGYTGEIVNVGSALFVSAGNGGVYKSTDNGESWFRSSSGLPLNEGVQTLLVHNETLYASMSRDGLYLSTDEAVSWSPINTGIDHLTFYAIGVEASSIYAGNANGGIYYSSDNGSSWVDKSVGISDIQFQDFAFFNSSVYAGGKSLYRTTDNGDTWEEVEVIGLGPNGVRSLLATEGTLYLGDDGHLFTSPDGIVWTKSTLDTGGTITTIGASSDSVYLTTSSGKFYYTKNDGLSWTLIQNNETTYFAQDVILLNDKIIMSTAEGLYSSTDNGVSWYESNIGISTIQIRALAMSESNLFAGTGYQGIYRSDLSGNWVKINSGLDAVNSASVYDISIVNNELVIATGGGVYSSVNNGDTWTRTFDPGINKSVQVLDYDDGNFVIGVSGTGIYISDDGTNWILTETAGLNVTTTYVSIEMVGETIVVSTANGEIFISEDLGLSWSNISISGGYYHTYDVQLVDEILYAGTSKGLLMSTDYGENWFFYNNEERSIKSLVFRNDKVYCASDDGIFIGSENGEVWHDVSDELGNQSVEKIIFSNDQIYAGTFAASVWERPIDEIRIPPLIVGSVGELLTLEDTPVSIELTDLAVVGDGSFPVGFTLNVLTGDNYTYESNVITPDTDFNGTLSVNLQVNDGFNNSPVFGLALGVTPVNDPPVITGQLNGLSTTEGVAITLNLDNLIVEDVDNNYPSDFSLSIEDGDGYTVLNSQVTPNAGVLGVLSVPVMVNDGELDSEPFLLSIDVAKIVGFENSFIRDNFSIHPNPVSNNLNIDYIKLYSSYRINLYATDGRLIYSASSVGNKTQSFNVSSIPKGMYLLQLITENQAGVIKLLKE